MPLNHSGKPDLKLFLTGFVLSEVPMMPYEAFSIESTGAQRRNGYLKEIFRAVLIISTMSGYSNKLLTSQEEN